MKNQVRGRNGYVMIFKSKYGNGTGTEKSQNWSAGTESVHFPVFRTLGEPQVYFFFFARKEGYMKPNESTTSFDHK